MLSACSASVLTMPSIVSPSPICASAVPNTERGRPTKRRSATPGATRADARLRREVGQRAEHQPGRKPDAERRKHRGAVDEKQHRQHRQDGAAEAAHRAAAPRAKTSPRFQASSGPNGTTTSSGSISGPKVMSKNGAPTEILSPVTASTNKRIERADEHGRGGGGQEQIVEDQRALARDRMEQAAGGRARWRATQTAPAIRR